MNKANKVTSLQSNKYIRLSFCSVSRLEVSVCVSVLAAAVGNPEHEGVQPSTELLRQRHDDAEVPVHRQVQVCLQAAQRAERLLPLLTVERGGVAG